MKNIWVFILCAIGLVALGFYFGRQTNDKIKIEYIAGETIRDTIVIQEPTFVEIPSKPKYIYKYDTIVVDNIQYISEKVDTSAIIQDYILTRTYEFNVFNSDTLGKFDVKQKIGYNKLLSFDYTFTPMTKQITHFKEPLFTPFVTMGYSTNQSVLVGGGVYYRHVGFEYNLNVSTQQQWQLNGANNNYHTVKLNYKF